MKWFTYFTDKAVEHEQHSHEDVGTILRARSSTCIFI